MCTQEKNEYAKKAASVITEFSRATGTNDLLPLIDKITVRTQSFEAVVNAELGCKIDKKIIQSPQLPVREDHADAQLKNHFHSLDERHEWLEYHLGLSNTFEKYRTCSCSYSETCHDCGGNGKTICHSCSGQGDKLCDNPYCRYGKTKCTEFNCYNGYSKCGYCSGIGYRDVNVQQGNDSYGNPIVSKRTTACTYCHGTGHGTPCRVCFGSAQVNCPSCKGTRRVPCDECHETGRLDCQKCNTLGYLSYEKTLTAEIRTSPSYVGDTAKDVEALRGISRSFSTQLADTEKKDLRHVSTGKTGRYAYKGEATYSYIRPKENFLVFVGHKKHPAQASQNLYKPVIKKFQKYITDLDIKTLEKTDFGKEILQCMCGDPPSKGSYLDLYDSAGTLRKIVDEVMPGIDRKIRHGEATLRLKYLGLCGLVAFLVYFIPFQDALSDAGLGDAFSMVTPISPWIIGGFVSMWGMPYIAMKMFNLARRRRRKIRSKKILGSSRKMKETGNFATWLAAMCVQVSVLAGTSFLSGPYFPEPCAESELGVKTCLVISVGGPFLAMPMIALSYIPGTGVMKDDIMYRPKLDEVRKVHSAVRIHGNYED